MNSSIVPLSRHAGPLAVSLVVVLLILGCGDVQAQTADDTLSGAKDAQPVAAPAPPAGGLASFLRQVTVYALGDGYLTANSNHPSDKENLLRNFDTRSGALRLNYVEAAFEKKATDKGRLGFRTDFGAGPASDLVGAAEPGAHQWQYVQQAYVSVLAPIGSGLTVDVGKFVTPAGAEVIETQDNWNYSRSLLFAWAIPYYHAGVRASYAMGTKATATGFVFNGWNNVKDNNSAKSLGAQVVLGPAARVTFAGTWIGGPEQTDADSWRNLIDAILTTAVTPKVKLVLNVDAARDRGLGPGVGWYGVAASVRAQVTPKWTVAPRVEWFSDPQGASTGVAQDLVETTLTAQRTIAAGLSARVEYRVDHSTTPVFPNGGGVGRPWQQTVGVGLFYGWASR